MDDSVLVTVWRRRWMVVALVAVATVTAAIVSKSLDKVYSTSSKLLVVQSANESFDAIQAAQVTARTYADVLSSPNIAGLVARRLGGGVTLEEVDRAVQIEPIPETQLLEIKAEAATPERAKSLADSYAEVFVDFAQARLATTTDANVTFADAAPLIRSPARPKPTLYVLLTLLLAVPAAVALALLRDRFDMRLRSVEDIEERLGVRVLTTVPRRGRGDPSIVAFEEAWRVLRTALRFAVPDGVVRTLAVTSWSEGEGKTTTAINLAEATLEAGGKVLLVEGDMLRASLVKRLADVHLGDHVDRERRGLAHYLIGAVPLDEAIQATGRENLSVIAAEPLEERLSGLLETPRGRTLAQDLAVHADLVIFDCPPLGVGADASAIAARVDAVILVVDLHMSTQNRLRQALKQLEAVKARMVGCVVNRDRSFKPTDYLYHPADHERAARELEEV